MTTRYRSDGHFAYGLGQGLLVLEGAALVVGAKAKDLPGASYTAKVESMKAMSPSEVEEFVKKEGFAAYLEVGSAVWVPTGYMHILVPSSAGCLLKWSAMTPNLKPGDAELQTLLATVTTMVSCYPSLQVAYKEWLQYLEMMSSTT
jgi:hypothetical protein